MAAPIWTAHNLIHYPLIEHVHLAPDGQQLLYTVRRPHLDDNSSEFRHTIYRVSTQDAQAPIALTQGATATQPRWRPDSHLIAFLRPAPDTDKLGLWLMRANGGEAWPITGEANSVRHAISRFQWSPDGSKIAFTVVPWDAEREQHRLQRDDVVHWRVDFDFAHLYVIAVDTAPAPLAPITRLTQGRLHVSSFNWRPNSAEIALIHQPTPYLESWSAARLATVAVAEAQGDTAPALVDRGEVAVQEGEPFYSPDGAWIACEVGDAEHSWPYASRIHLFPTRLSMPEQEDGAPQSLAAVSDAQPKLLGWSPDSQAVYVQDAQGMGMAVLALPIDGGAPQTLIPADRLISATYVNPQGQMALVLEDFTTPQAVHLVDLTAPAAPRLVAQAESAGYPAGPLPKVQTLRWTTPDGTEIEGILYLPADYVAGQGEKLPLLLHIHGGPASVFQRQFAAHPYYYTPAALCERGIAVLRCNPRGSGGYGKQFRRANVRDWGGADYRDLMQGVDLVIEQGIADPDRLGVAGWSYGGFMTSWIITQTHRFQAASIGAPVTNLVSFVGTADIPSFIPSYFGGEPWQEHELYHARSPLYQAYRARTPAIIQHGDADERVPLEQGLQYYSVLQRNGVPVDLYIYPRQGHAISEPRLLADAIERNLAWFTGKLVDRA